MKYKTIKDAMNSVDGKVLYRILVKQFDNALKIDPALSARMGRLPTYLGSQRHIECIVWNSLNALEQAKKFQGSNISEEVSIDP